MISLEAVLHLNAEEIGVKVTEFTNLLTSAAQLRRPMIVQRAFVHAVEMCKADIRLEILRPVEGGSDSKPPAVSIRNQSGALLRIANGRGLVSNAATERPEGVHAEVVSERVEVGVNPIVFDV